MAFLAASFTVNMMIFITIFLSNVFVLVTADLHGLEEFLELEKEIDRDEPRWSVSNFFTHNTL